MPVLQDGTEIRNAFDRLCRYVEDLAEPVTRNETVQVASFTASIIHAKTEIRDELRNFLSGFKSGADREFSYYWEHMRQLFEELEGGAIKPHTAMSSLEFMLKRISVAKISLAESS